MIIDLKDSLQSYNTKIGKQCIQYHDIAKLGYILYLTPKIDISY